ncbi:MAG: LCP family protein [Patescibacteria group bacterium]
MALLPEITIPPSPQATNRGKFFLYLLLIGVLVFMTWWSRQPHVQATLADWGNHPVWENIKRLVMSSDKMLEGEADGRINILLLGMGGVAHEGPYLTDTIILLSINPETADVAMLSIPRDLAVNIPEYGIRKINNANAYGEAKQKGSGVELASEVLATTLAVPIHYYARIDFSGFIGLIDQLSGLKINVEQSFIDPQFPTNDGLTQTVSFTAGEQLMSGARVLQYVRSRHGSNGQGSDFSRAHRQQQVLLAAKEKILRLSTFLNPQLIIRLYQTFQNNIETNIEPWAALKLSNLLKDLDTSRVVHKVLDIESTGLLTETRGEDGAYLLIPINNDYVTLQLLTQKLLTFAKVPEEKAKVVINNGTAEPGLAEKLASVLKERGFEVINYGNAPNKNYTKSVIYDFSNNQPASKDILYYLLKSPDWGSDNVTPQQGEDFLIIVGSEQSSSLYP